MPAYPRSVHIAVTATAPAHTSNQRASTRLRCSTSTFKLAPIAQRAMLRQRHSWPWSKREGVKMANALNGIGLTGAGRPVVCDWHLHLYPRFSFWTKYLAFGVDRDYRQQLLRDLGRISHSELLTKTCDGGFVETQYYHQVFLPPFVSTWSDDQSQSW